MAWISEAVTNLGTTTRHIGGRPPSSWRPGSAAAPCPASSSITLPLLNQPPLPTHHPSSAAHLRLLRALLVLVRTEAHRAPAVEHHGHLRHGAVRQRRASGSARSQRKSQQGLLCGMLGAAPPSPPPSYTRSRRHTASTPPPHRPHAASTPPTCSGVMRLAPP